MIKLTPNFTANTALATSVTKNGTQDKSNPGFEKSSKRPQQEYNDPLMKWPVRGFAFTNDIGAAIMDIAPKLGTLLWYPAMMYFGADIYDKYRNDKETYNPNAKRGLNQAIFQTLASVVFPIAVVHTGQKAASVIARNSKAGLSLQTQEEADKFLLNFMSERKLRKYSDKIDVFKDELRSSLDTSIDETTRKHKNTNVVKKFFNLIFGGRHPEEMGKERRPKIHKFVEDKVDLLFKMHNDLIKGNKPENLSQKLFDEFNSLKKQYTASTNKKLNDHPVAHAAKDILKKFESSQIFKVKMWKTVGGFAMLGLFIKPIDIFVEKVIMHKYVTPGITNFGKSQVSKFKEQTLN